MMTGLLKKILHSKLIRNSTAHGSNRRRRLPDKGHVRISVGIKDPRQFDIKTHYLNHPLFTDLLRLSSVEEFGYSYNGVVRIRCDIDLFNYLVHLLDSGNPQVHYMEYKDLVSDFYKNQNQRQQQIFREAQLVLLEDMHDSLINRLNIIINGAKLLHDKSRQKSSPTTSSKSSTSTFYNTYDSIINRVNMITREAKLRQDMRQRSSPAIQICGQSYRV